MQHAQQAVGGDAADFHGVESPLAKTAKTSCSRPRSATSSMRSCDSLSIISYGVMPVSRCGTRSSSISMPTPPREAISHEELVSPAAPMS